MYVTSLTTESDIRRRIAEIENDLNYRMDRDTRETLHDELDYLYSFLPEEKF